MLAVVFLMVPVSPASPGCVGQQVNSLNGCDQDYSLWFHEVKTK